VASFQGKRLDSFLSRMVSLRAIGYALFHLYAAVMGPLPNIVQRSFHVSGILALLYLMSLQKERTNIFKGSLDFILMCSAIGSSIYIYINFERILQPMFTPGPLDMLFASLLVVAILESARRLIGLFIPALAVLLIVYAYFGDWFPGMWKHGGVSIEYIAQVIYFSTRGIWGVITEVSSSVIIIFVIFGSVLFASGGGNTFMDLASWLTADSKGGAAKVATVASSLFGTINGSAAANVATTGSFTIPMMKRLGYKPEFAAGVESSASSGGQIMPPIMGAGAFIMAELLAIPYKEVMFAAIIPSVLFYFGVMTAIHFEAGKNNYRGLPREQIPKLMDILHWSKSLTVFLPIGVLMYYFLNGYTPAGSAFRAIAVLAVLYLLTDLKDIKNRIIVLFKGLEQSSKDMLSVVVLIAAAQIILSMLTLTGIGVKFVQIIIGIGHSHILLAGFCAMIATMILGMGLPTVAAYLLAAAVIAPALVRLGTQPVAAHFFVFFYAIFAGITPPICGTVYVGAAIAKADWIKTAWVAMRLSVAAFIVPFMFLLSPALLLVGTVPEIAWSTATSTLGVFALAAGGMGYYLTETKLYERLFLVAAGIVLIEPHLITDIVGISLFAAVTAIQWFRKKVVKEELSMEN
jgi:TRAP transporter 4TM/12TM fusion protein